MDESDKATTEQSVVESVSNSSAVAAETSAELEEGELQSTSENDTGPDPQSQGVTESPSLTVADFSDPVNSSSEAQRETEEHAGSSGRLTLRVARKTWIEAMHSGKSPSLDDVPSANDENVTASSDVVFEEAVTEQSVTTQPVVTESEVNTTTVTPQSEVELDSQVSQREVALAMAADSEVQSVSARFESEAEFLPIPSSEIDNDNDNENDADTAMINAPMNEAYSMMSSEDEDDRGKLMIVDAETNLDDSEQLREEESTAISRSDEPANTNQMDEEIEAEAEARAQEPIQADAEAEPEAEAEAAAEGEPDPEEEVEAAEAEAQAEAETVGDGEADGEAEAEADVGETEVTTTTSQPDSVAPERESMDDRVSGTEVAGASDKLIPTPDTEESVFPPTVSATPAAVPVAAPMTVTEPEAPVPPVTAPVSAATAATPQRQVETMVTASADDAATVTSSTATESSKQFTLRISRSQIISNASVSTISSNSATGAGACAQRAPLPVIVVKTHEKREKEKAAASKLDDSAGSNSDASKTDNHSARCTEPELSSESLSGHKGTEVSSSPSAAGSKRERERECKTRKDGPKITRAVTQAQAQAQPSASSSPNPVAQSGNGSSAAQRKLRSHTAAQNQAAAAAAAAAAVPSNEQDEDCIPIKKKRLRSNRPGAYNNSQTTLSSAPAQADESSNSAFDYTASVQEVKVEQQVDAEFASPTGLADLYVVWQRAREIADQLRMEEARSNEDVNLHRAFACARRKAWDRVRSLVRIQPNAPRNFSDYVMITGAMGQPVAITSRPTRMLTDNAALNELYMKQATERERLAMQQSVERDRARVSCEQEVLRVHTRAAQRLANQSTPFSVCSVLFLSGNVELSQLDDEALERAKIDIALNYCADADQCSEEMVGHNGLSLNASAQANSSATNANGGRQTRLAARLAALNATVDEMATQPASQSQSQANLLASTSANNRHLNELVAEVIEKFEKIKQSLVYRHRCEAIALHATQRLDFEAKMKKLGLCELHRHPAISDDDVPLVHVVADFPLLPTSAI